MNVPRNLKIFLVALLLVGCAQAKPSEDSGALPDSGITAEAGVPVPALFPHAAGWKNASAHGSGVPIYGLAACLECHKKSSTQPENPPACHSCHSLYPHGEHWSDQANHGAQALRDGRAGCMTECHGFDLQGGLSGVSCSRCHALYPHAENWSKASEHGVVVKQSGERDCQGCHGEDLKGGNVGVSCYQCHEDYPHGAGWGTQDEHGLRLATSGNTTCMTECHGANLQGGLSGVSCQHCHELYPHAAVWRETHGTVVAEVGKEACQKCHGSDFRKILQEKTCYSCHADYPHPREIDWLPYENGHGHLIKERGNTADCEKCHGMDLKKVKDGKTCFTCHPAYPHQKVTFETWKNYEGHGAYVLSGSKKECRLCHGDDLKGGGRGNPSCYECHPSYPHNEGWLQSPGGVQGHGEYVKLMTSSSCATSHCHGEGLVWTKGVVQGPSCVGCHPSYPHPEGWKNGGLHGPIALANISLCRSCHGDGLDQAPTGYQSCKDCHPSYLEHSSAGKTGWETYEGHGRYIPINPITKKRVPEACQLCHGTDYAGGVSNKSCQSAACHPSFPHETRLNWDQQVVHGIYVLKELGNQKEACKLCHGNDLKGGNSQYSCYGCHTDFTHGETWKEPTNHGVYVLKTLNKDKTSCKACHGDDLTGAISGQSCFAAGCHTTMTHEENWGTAVGHGNHLLIDLKNDKTSCKLCHGDDLGGGSGQACNNCHSGQYPHVVPKWVAPGLESAHAPIALELKKQGKLSQCAACHGEKFNRSVGGVACTDCHPNATQENFAPTGDCQTCHTESQNGRRVILGDNGDFSQTSHHVGSGIQSKDCLVCHEMKDHRLGKVILKDPDQGSQVTYGYDPTNPAGVEDFCVHCHDADGAKAAGGLTPFSNGQGVPNVTVSASNDLWINSAHRSKNYLRNNDKPLSCFGDGVSSGCHGNAHGSQKHKLLAPADQTADATTHYEEEEGFCYNCHKGSNNPALEGGIENRAISGEVLSKDIQQAFGLNFHHPVGDQESGHLFTVGGKSFELECTTCHNPHFVSGKYWEADKGVSPVTLPDFSGASSKAMGTKVWGNEAGEKMDDYAGHNPLKPPQPSLSGVYQTPVGDSFSGSQLPDYVSFCLACHAEPGDSPFGFDGSNKKDWGKSTYADPHGKGAAEVPYARCPTDTSCGEGNGLWPRVSKGRGFNTWIQTPYDQEKRMAGDNFVLSCTDCHEAHGSSFEALFRKTVNGAALPDNWNWKNLCLQCHRVNDAMWDVKGDDSGCMTCHAKKFEVIPGYVPHSLHGMSDNTNWVGWSEPHTILFDSTQVADIRFDSHDEYWIKDSGTWNLYGRGIDYDTNSKTVKWDVNFRFDTVGGWARFSPGKTGDALVLDGVDDEVELGAQNDWPAALYGTQQFFEVKDNLTLAAWICPVVTYAVDPPAVPDITYTLVSNEVMGTSYGLKLKTIDGAVRALLQVNVSPGVARAAFSSVSIPVKLAKEGDPFPACQVGDWVHVAASFNQAGPDRSGGDSTVGRIRVYVNGVDVTTSNASYLQPDVGENQILPAVDKGYLSRFVIGATPIEVLPALPWSKVPVISGTNNFKGMIDSVKIFNVTKTAAEIQASMQEP